MHDLEFLRANRYRVAAPVSFWWPDADESVQASEGTTRDISGNGLMVLAGRCPPVGVRVQMTVFISRSGIDPFPMELHGEGSVVRIEYGKIGNSGTHPVGFAASVYFHQEMPSDSRPIEQ